MVKGLDSKSSLKDFGLVTLSQINLPLRDAVEKNRSSRPGSHLFILWAFRPAILHLNRNACQVKRINITKHYFLWKGKDRISESCSWEFGFVEVEMLLPKPRSTKKQIRLTGDGFRLNLVFETKSWTGLDVSPNGLLLLHVFCFLSPFLAHSPLPTQNWDLVQQTQNYLKLLISIINSDGEALFIFLLVNSWFGGFS